MPPKTARQLDRFSQFGLVAGRLALDDAGLTPGVDGARASAADRDLPRVGARRDRLRRGAARALPRDGASARSRRTSRSRSSVARRRPTSGSRSTSADRSCRPRTRARPGRSRSARRWATCARAGSTPRSPAASRSRSARSRSARSTSSGRCRPATTTSPGTAERPFDRGRDGFVMGEGAALLVLEAAEVAEARGAVPYAELLGYGATSDAHHMVQPRADGTEAAPRRDHRARRRRRRTRRDRLRQRPCLVDADRRRRRGAGDRAGARRAGARPCRSAAPRRCTAIRWERPARSRPRSAR